MKLKSRIILFIEKKINPVRVKILAKAFGCKFNIGKNVRIAGKIEWLFGTDSEIKLQNNTAIYPCCVMAVCEGAKVNIGEEVYIGPGTELISRGSISIGSKSLIAQNCKIIDCNHEWSKEDGVRRNNFIVKPIEIGSKVWLGANVVVTAGSIIEDNCLIGAGVIVRGHIKKGSRVVV